MKREELLELSTNDFLNALRESEIKEIDIYRWVELNFNIKELDYLLRDIEKTINSEQGKEYHLFISNARKRLYFFLKEGHQTYIDYIWKDEEKEIDYKKTFEDKVADRLKPFEEKIKGKKYGRATFEEETMEEERFRRHIRKEVFFEMRGDEWLDFEAIEPTGKEFKPSHFLNQMHTLKGVVIDIIENQKNEPPREQGTTPEPMEEQKTEQKATPQLRPEAVQEVFDILKTYFAKEEYDELRKLLETFGTTKNKLTFMGECNKLADFFKQLIENSYILPYNKTELSKWISDNFKYTEKNSNIKECKLSTVYKTLSDNTQPCKEPIIRIYNGKIERID